MTTAQSSIGHETCPRFGVSEWVIRVIRAVTAESFGAHLVTLRDRPYVPKHATHVEPATYAKTRPRGRSGRLAGRLRCRGLLGVRDADDDRVDLVLAAAEFDESAGSRDLGVADLDGLHDRGSSSLRS